MEELKKEAEGSGHGGFAGDPVTATTDMCTFLILNISTLAPYQEEMVGKGASWIWELPRT